MQCRLREEERGEDPQGVLWGGAVVAVSPRGHCETCGEWE